MELAATVPRWSCLMIIAKLMREVISTLEYINVLTRTTEDTGQACMCLCTLVPADCKKVTGKVTGFWFVSD